MHHPRAHNLNPAAVPANTAAVARAVTGKAVDGHIHPRLHKGKIIAAETHLALGPEQPPGKLVQRPFQVGKGNAGIDGQALDLIEMPFVGGVGSLVAVALARHHHPHRRLRPFHHPRLHRRGMGTEQHRPPAGGVGVIHPKGVPHIPGRVARRNVQPLKIIVIPLHFRPFDNAETHGHESVGDFPHHPGGQMQPAAGYRPPRQGNIDPFPVGGLGLLVLLNFRRPPGQALLQVGFSPVAQSAQFPPLLQGNLGQAAQDGGKAAASAQPGYPPLFQSRRVGQSGQFLPGGAGQFVNGLSGRRRQGQYL